MQPQSTISQVLCELLLERGVNHVFGIPGDYALSLFDTVTQSEISMVNTCDEQGAGFAADAYARVNGLGAALVNVGFSHHPMGLLGPMGSHGAHGTMGHREGHPAN